MNRYEVIIYWSEEDEAYVAEVPELPGVRRTRRHAGGGAGQDGLLRLRPFPVVLRLPLDGLLQEGLLWNGEYHADSVVEALPVRIAGNVRWG